MTINIALVMSVCGALTTGASVYYGDLFLAYVGATLCYFAGFNTGKNTTLTVNWIEPKP